MAVRCPIRAIRRITRLLIGEGDCSPGGGDSPRTIADVAEGEGEATDHVLLSDRVQWPYASPFDQSQRSPVDLERLPRSFQLSEHVRDINFSSNLVVPVLRFVLMSVGQGAEDFRPASEVLERLGQVPQ